MTDDRGQIAAPAIKAISAWGVLAVTSWADIAAALAAAYTLLLIIEWLWKKRTWRKRRNRRTADRS